MEINRYLTSKSFYDFACNIYVYNPLGEDFCTYCEVGVRFPRLPQWACRCPMAQHWGDSSSLLCSLCLFLGFLVSSLISVSVPLSVFHLIRKASKQISARERLPFLLQQCLVSSWPLGLSCTF